MSPRAASRGHCRRTAAAGLFGVGAAMLLGAHPSRAEEGRARGFMREAERQRQAAMDAGDQPFGAVLVLADEIAGWGPSRVIQDRNGDAHAERVALWDAQRRLGRSSLAGAVMYSTSRPCPACQDALAQAGVSRMIHGPALTDAGPPRRW